MPSNYHIVKKVSVSLSSLKLIMYIFVEIRETSTLCSLFLNGVTSCYNISGDCQDFARCSIVRSDV